MQDSVVRFCDLELDCQPGITELYTESLGLVTFIGFSKEGDAVVQMDDNFTTIPELTWNVMVFERPFEAETHVRYLKEEDVNRLNNEEFENILQVDLAEYKNMLYQYEAVITIKKVYDQLGRKS